MVTNTCTLENINDGYQDMLDGKNIRGVIKFTEKELVTGAHPPRSSSREHARRPPLRGAQIAGSNTARPHQLDVRRARRRPAPPGPRR